MNKIVSQVKRESSRINKNLGQLVSLDKSKVEVRTMVKMLEIREMLRLVDRSSLEELEVINGSLRISIKKGETADVLPSGESIAPMIHTADQQVAAASDVSECEPQATPQPHVLQSINIGTFQSLANPGDKVEIGSLIGHCSVTALNLKFDITSDQSGVISEVLVEEGQLIDYGQPLYKITVGKELVHV